MNKTEQNTKMQLIFLMKINKLIQMQRVIIYCTNQIIRPLFSPLNFRYRIEKQHNNMKCKWTT